MTKHWDPLTIGNAADHGEGMTGTYYRTRGRKHYFAYRNPQPAVNMWAFHNRLYNGHALVFEDGSMHLSFKRNDRAAVRDWRHVQAIKNEVAGIDREAVEIYPIETNLVDAANEYHLWVLPPGTELPLGFRAYEVGAAADEHDHAAYRQTGKAGARQRAFEPGLPTGLPFREQVLEAARALVASGWRPDDDQDPTT